MQHAAHSDSLCLATWRSRPGSFVSLMTLYESNYIRLRQLVGEPNDLSDRQESHVGGDCPLLVRVDERCRYTTTFTMTYRFTDGASEWFEPDLQVRVYHDARLAEALHCDGWSRHPVWTEMQNRLPVRSIRRDMGDRWRHNIMLNKWLEYCLDRGHRFMPR